MATVNLQRLWDALVEASPRSAEVALSFLAGDIQERMLAAELLRYGVPDRVIEPLLAMIERDPVSEVRTIAAESLRCVVRGRSPGEIDARLERAFDTHSDPETRVAIALLIEAFSEPPPRLVARVRQVLLRYDESPQVREAAARVLGVVCSEIVGNTLMIAVRLDPEPMVRARAAASLGQIGDSRAVSLLIKAARFDPAAEVRQEALVALASLDFVQARRLAYRVLFDPNTSPECAGVAAQILLDSPDKNDLLLLIHRVQEVPHVMVARRILIRLLRLAYETGSRAIIADLVARNEDQICRILRSEEAGFLPSPLRVRLKRSLLGVGRFIVYTGGKINSVSIAA